MIRQIDGDYRDLLEFCGRDSFGTRVAASEKAYSSLGGFARFYAQEIDGEISAAASCVDGNFTLCADLERADSEEIICFIRASGYKTLISDVKFYKKIGAEPSLTGAVVSFEGNDSLCENKTVIEYSMSEDYKTIYSILQVCGFSDIGSYYDWLADISHRVRRGVSKIFIAKYGAIPCATASVLFQTDTNAFMGGVGTLPAFRSRGVAGALVSDIARDLTQTGFGVTLFCRDSLLEFYEKNGFIKNGSWAIMKAEEDK